MSKAVLISIQPKWCELIASGKKTLEVRKNRPKLVTPFKCYIYCALGDHRWRSTDREFQLFFGTGSELSNGKVVGEFVCDRIDVNTPDLLVVKEDRERSTSGSCLTAEELRDYLRGKQSVYCLSTLPDLFCWHISGLVIYEHPKGLGEFTGLRKTKFGFEPVSLNRPPQSWCYVDELEGESEK